MRNLSPPYDMLLAADVLYQKEAIAALLQTMYDLTHGESAILMTFEAHNEVAAFFLTQVHRFFELTYVPDDEQHPVYRLPGSIRLCRLKRNARILDE